MFSAGEALQLTTAFRCFLTAHPDCAVPVPADDALTVTFEYSVDLLDESTVEAWGRSFTALLGAVAADPDRPLRSLRGTGPGAPGSDEPHGR